MPGSLFDDDPAPLPSAAAAAGAVPLAERLRPRTLDEVIGQRHLLGPDKPLRAAFEPAGCTP
jgi:putative ATPase